jgi:predicted nucleotidyltransferase
MRLKENNGPVQRMGEAPPIRLWHPHVPGPLWNGTRRVKFSQIKAYCQVLAREIQSRKIILFGSYASGSATPDSDVDLVVLLPFRGFTTEKAVQIRGKVEAPFPLDLLVWRPSDAKKDNSFTRSVLHHGKVMYEAKHS